MKRCFLLDQPRGYITTTLACQYANLGAEELGDGVELGCNSY
jgi:hypothetical protein